MKKNVPMGKSLAAIVQIRLPRCRACGREGIAAVAALLGQADIPCPACAVPLGLADPGWQETLWCFARACRNAEAGLARASRRRLRPARGGG